MAARFWVGGTGNWSDTAHWALTSGGAGGQAVPTSSDDVTLDANSGANATVTVDVAANANSVTINKSDITLIMSAALTVVGATTLTTGTFNTNGQAFTTGTFLSSNSNVRTITLGASLIVIKGNGVNGTSGAWETGTTTNLTFSAGTSTIKFTAITGAGVLFTPGGLSYNNITRDVTGATTQIANSLFINGNLTVTGTFTANGTTAAPNGRIVIVGQGAPGQGQAPKKITITAAAVSLSNVNFLNVIGAGAASWTGTSMGDCGSNSGITFDAPVNRYAVASGNLDSTAKWATSSGGATGASIPLPQDTALFDVAAPAGTYTFNWFMIPSIDCANGTGGAFTRTLSTGGNTWNLCGSLIMVSGMTFTDFGGGYTFVGDRAASITQAGRSLTGIIGCSKVGGTLTQNDDLSTTSTNSQALRLNAGTWDMNGHNLTGFALNTNGGGAIGYAEVRALQMRGGTLTLNGTGTVWGTGQNQTNLSILFTAGSALIDITDATATAKTFQTAGLAYPKLRHIAAGAAGLTIVSGGGNPGGSFYDLDLECATARTVTIPSITDPNHALTVIRNLILQGASGQLLSLVSGTVGSPAPIQVQSGRLDQINSFVSLSSDIKLRRRASHHGCGLAQLGVA